MIKRLRLLVAPLMLVFSITIAQIVPLATVSTVVPLVAVSALVVSQSACDKGTMLSWSKKAVSALEKVSPTLTGAGINVALITEAIRNGKLLIAAFEANNNESAIGYTDTFITAFEAIVVDTERITNPLTRTLALAIMAVVDEAIHFIADNLNVPDLPVGMRGSPAVTKIKQYGAKKAWNCRNSQTGRYEKMSFCKDNPAGSTVETR